MKKILTLVLISALGGILTLGGYKLFIEEDSQPLLVETSKPELPVFIPTSNTNALLTSIEKPNLVEAANKTIDAVVHVKNTQLSRGPETWSDAIRGIYTERKQLAGAGSGVIISPDGHIITNNHVVKGAAELSVTLNNNKTYPAKLIGSDEKTDIALLKVEADTNLPFITFGDSDTTQIGEWVLAVGNPFNLTSTVTAGIISAKSRDLSGGQSFIQTDAAVNPGNSGGALVNTNGDLIGINTAISSQTGSYVGYSFAVPSNIARKIVADIMEFGDVQNGILGVSGLGLNSEVAEELGIKSTEGFYISNIEEQSGADLAGLFEGDIIRKIDNVEINKFSDLSGYLNTKSPNDIVNVEVNRNGNLKAIPVTLTKKEDLYTEFMNMQLKNIPKKISNEYPNLKSGAYIIDNKNYYFYNKVGLRNGYIITAINDIKINTINDIIDIKEKYGSDFSEHLYKLEYLDQNLNRKEKIFR